MNPEAYLEMSETESRHWWFSARRSILSRLIENLDLPQQSNILEVGCGTGGNLQMLSQFGSVAALETNATARAIAIEKTQNKFELRPGHCPDNIPFQDQHFDLICMFDVLEHIDQDTETLIALKQMLASDGRIILTVPAYQWLWSSHDEFLNHKRRYTLGRVRQIAVSAGLSPVKKSYFNTLLFPVIAVARLIDKLMGGSSVSGRNVPVDPLNGFLRALFGAERFLIDRLQIPFGASLVFVLESAKK